MRITRTAHTTHDAQTFVSGGALHALAARFDGWLRTATAVVLLSVVAACGGGGGDSNSSSSSNSSVNTDGLPASPTAQPIAAGAANTVAVTVGAGLSGVVNIPTVSVTICAPGSTTNCQTIDNIQVDTGSYGLRIVGSVLNSTLSGAMPVNAAPNVSSAQLAECTRFADGYSWGTIRNATVKIGGETASTIPIQLIGDLASSTIPTSGCINGSSENTVSDLGANGILGIGVAPYDCGTTCQSASTAATYSNYYACPTSGAACSRTAVPTGQQVANPVAHFTTDNNGVILQMSPVSNAGSAGATGTLVFGIGTQSNNALAAANVFNTDSYGDMNSSTFNGSKVTAFLDSGSNGYFFSDSTLTLCSSNYSGFYCPSSSQTRTVTLVGTGGNSLAAQIGIANAQSLFRSGNNNYAFNDLAGQLSTTGIFDLGLPYFYGRYVYYGMDQTASGGQSPYVAF
ncbi:DUF3443 domain-containing protein [Paraburkholderia sp.]|uniref:DUF3443 domain-containing protein n=1 Tax=Paraburkholderia sp. TaxID=1926495 RepID=UPI00239DF4FF|nr:DUF3443 domain-containing protein [Paraburkholderia sp.]MDE1181247.1 DUF3443 domain-containing protein [Paraburkholderia sp.]